MCVVCIAERLFEVIDKDRSDSIGYNEFLHGVAILFRGSRTEKLKFIFDLYDLSRYRFVHDENGIPCN